MGMLCCSCRERVFLASVPDPNQSQCKSLSISHASGRSRNLEGGFSGECSEQRREVLICLPREAWKKCFAVIFQLPGWAVVAPLCFTLHCPLVSVQSLTVCMTLAMRSCSSSRRGLIPCTKKCLNVYLPYHRTVYRIAYLDPTYSGLRT